MADLKKTNPSTKNSMPVFVHTTYNNLLRGLEDNKVKPPIFGFCSDLECMIYVSHEGKVYKILVDRIQEIESQLEDLVDPETGKPIKVTKYVQEKVEPVEIKVNEVNESVYEIQRKGAAILLTSKDGGGE